MARKRRHFTKEFKTEAVRVVRDRGKTVGQSQRNSISSRQRCGRG
jgi:hypothetical protein